MSCGTLHSDTVDALQSLDDVEVLLDEPMARHTSLCVGGPADVFVRPTSIQALAQIIKVAKTADTPTLPIGEGTNIIVRDGGIRGIVIEIGGNLSRIKRNGQEVSAEAGARIAELCRRCCDWDLSGLEFAAGIPGSVGGALVMNAGAYNGEMADVVKSVVAVTRDGDIQHLHHDELELGYRKSIFQTNGMVIAKASFELTPGDGGEIRHAMYECLERRCNRQPVSGRSAGSIFKRPEGDYAGRLLEEAGAKGYRVGGAMISNKHAGFIVTEGNCTATDILTLIDSVRERVHDKFRIWLEAEVMIAGTDQRAERKDA
ncbi:MAG: UDP-N-acetylmuramate dehydrogenase [Armatimonadota bacterium]